METTQMSLKHIFVTLRESNTRPIRPSRRLNHSRTLFSFRSTLKTSRSTLIARKYTGGSAWPTGGQRRRALTPGTQPLPTTSTRNSPPMDCRSDIWCLTFDMRWQTLMWQYTIVPYCILWISMQKVLNWNLFIYLGLEKFTYRFFV